MFQRTYSLVLTILMTLCWAAVGLCQTVDRYGRDIGRDERLRADQAVWAPVFRPSGTISFAPYTARVTGSWPEVVAVGDVNDDGRNDVVLATSYGFDTLNDYKVYVYIQDSLGGLKPPVKYRGGDASSIDIADLDNDFLQDVALGHGDSVGILFQDPQGGLTPMVSRYSGRMVDGIVAGDFNSDGRTDVAVCHWQEDFVRVLYQRPVGNFDSSVTCAVNRGGYDELDCGDVNHDGSLDLVLMRGQLYANQNIAVFLQDSFRLLPPIYHDLGDTNCHGVAVGDVNGDWRVDVVASYGGNQPDAGIAVWLQDSSGILAEPAVRHDCYDCPEPVVIADFDGDGRRDVAVADGGWNAVSIYQQNPAGQLEPYLNFGLPYASHYQPQGMAAGDINGDGRPDLVFADYNNGLVILHNTSPTGVIGQTDITVLPYDRIAVSLAPNPLRQSTIINYQLSSSSHARVSVYNVAGQLVRTLVDGFSASGSHVSRWDGRDDGGTRVSSGIYIVRCRTNSGTAAARLLLVR